MRLKHLCDAHPPFAHTEQCLALCGFCGTDLGDHSDTASGECLLCGRITCENCDGDYIEGSGTICAPCLPVWKNGNKPHPRQ